MISSGEDSEDAMKNAADLRYSFRNKKSIRMDIDSTLKSLPVIKALKIRELLNRGLTPENLRAVVHMVQNHM